MDTEFLITPGLGPPIFDLRCGIIIHTIKSLAHAPFFQMDCASILGAAVAAIPCKLRQPAAVFCFGDTLARSACLLQGCYSCSRHMTPDLRQQLRLTSCHIHVTML